MLPMSNPVPTLENTWDIHYRDLEPVLASRLAETPDSLEIRDELARVYRGQAKYDQAAELYRHALELREAVSGKGSIELVPTLENLARVDQLLRKLDEAETLLARAIAIREAAQGPEQAEPAVCD